MGNGLPLGQLSHLGARIGLHRVSQHPDSGQDFVCPENLVELPATFCRLDYTPDINIQNANTKLEYIRKVPIYLELSR